MMPTKHDSWLQRKLLPGLATGVFHSLGIMVLAVLIFIPFMASDAWTLYMQAFSQSAFLASAMWDILLHIRLASYI